MMDERKLFPFQPLLIIILVVLISSYLLQPTTSISFDFPDFNNNNNIVRFGDCPQGQNLICLQGDAGFHDLGGLELTSNRQNKPVYFGSGRVVYSDPIPLRDNRTNTATNFTTEFLFGIDTSDAKPHGDGIAFFLSPYPSIIPPNSTGGLLGLTSSSAPNSSTFVAVEFDSVQNTWDETPVDHVGIDVNSVKSKVYANLTSGGFDGVFGRAHIEYNAVTKNLALFLDFNDNPFWLGDSMLSYNVDLSVVLPEQVAIGFSSSTNGSSAESHRILSWKFSTTFDDSVMVYSKTKKRGTIAAMIALLVCLVLLMLACVLRKRFNKLPNPRAHVRL